MNNTLKELQNKIFHSMRNNDLQSSIDLIVSNKINAFERLQTYQKSSNAKPYSCLSDDFIVTKKIIGEDEFNKIAKRYFEEHPADTHYINECGRHFTKFLKDHINSENYPFIIELANLEWNRVLSFYNFFEYKNANQNVTQAENLKINPSVIIINSEWPLSKIWHEEKAYSKHNSVVFIWTTYDRRVLVNSWESEENLVLAKICQTQNLETTISDLAPILGQEKLTVVLENKLAYWINSGLLEIRS